jgi:hypothetical protein
MKKFIRFPVYPLFFSLYPVLSLLAHNRSQVNFKSGVRSLLVSLLGTIILALLFRLLYSDWHRSAFVVMAWVLLFFTFGQIYLEIDGRWNPPYLLEWLIAIWSLLCVAVLILAFLRKINFRAPVIPLNAISLCLLIYPSFLLVQWSLLHAKPVQHAPAGPDLSMHVPTGEILPDIYYIMPEDYGRVDLLKSMMHINVDQFMQYLKDTGFYVAGCSQSNYATSELSLGSSLNMSYLQDLGPKFTPDNLDQGPIWNAIRYNSVSAALRKAGYKTVAFATGFSWSELDNSDVYLAPPLLWSSLTSFEIQLLRTTPLMVLEDLGTLDLNEIDGQRYRERTTLDFNRASALAHMPGPKFVFMHIIAPHEPFVFGPDGSPIDPAPFMDSNQMYTRSKYIQGYQDQVPFVNLMLEKTITTLIKQSSRPLVILLQTDTAPLFTTGSDTFKILNAYYMPGHTGQLYSGISPVNSFRVVFNAYLGTNLPLLPDQSYYSPIPHIYNFSIVPNNCSNP